MISLRSFGVYFFVFLICLLFSCNGVNENSPPNLTGNENEEEEIDTEDLNEGFNLPNIDLSHWKVTLPVGSPSEVEPPEILSYTTNLDLKKYMYNDSLNGALVFFTEPGSTTANSKYSRTELREQLVPGSNNVNWTFEQGGHIKGTLNVESVSGEEGDKDRLIVMQIHGRLTNAQRDLIDEDDNNAPPVLKIYWDNGKIDVRRKVLKDLEVDDIEILRTSAWKDESHWFEKEVAYDKFRLEVTANSDKLEIILNNDEKLTFDDIHHDKWAIFENYFKAGNYLSSTDTASFSVVKYYDLVVTH